MITATTQTYNEEYRNCSRTVLTVIMWKKLHGRQLNREREEKKKRQKEKSRKICIVLGSELMFSVLLLENVLKLLWT